MEKAVALLSVFGLGMCFTLLGSISVKLMPRLNIDKGKFGSLISAFMFSCLVASLIVGVVIRYNGAVLLPAGIQQELWDGAWLVCAFRLRCNGAKHGR